MATRKSTDGQPTTDRPTIAASAGIGAVAAALGYLVTALLVRDEVRENMSQVAEWKGTAWYYYSAHLVELETSGAFGGFSGSTTVDLIAQSGSANAELLYAIPPLVLVLSGALLAHHLHASDLGEAVAVGAPVTIGYALVLGLGVFATESSTEGSVFGIDASSSVAPELVPAIVLAGILYPLVFATAGAAIGVLVDQR